MNVDSQNYISNLHACIYLRRATIVDIMLTKVKMPPPDMVVGILAMNDALLDVDQIEAILKFCPTKEEMEQLKNYAGDVEKLGQCEQVCDMPANSYLFSSFIFYYLNPTSFQLADFKNNLNTVKAACDEVCKSVKLKEVMKRILYLGNTLNQGTARGAAVGFKLDALLRLEDTHTLNSRMILMHYLCKLFANKSPDLIEFPDDLVNLEAATKIQLKTLADEMLALSNGLRKMKQELDACANDGPISAGFHSTLKRFIKHAEAEMTSVTIYYSAVVKSADGLALYFGEDPARCPFEQATEILFNFMRLFQKCHEENLIRQAELERRNAENDVGNS
ncbi:putative formin-like protein 15b [Bidens hawaiensis]|uniref:putative formin-like protein 15b n=1 Tax=Bidens hawaiensis TaxID=980011 RepID=UPI004049035D